jgi:hypothetical protein
MEDDREPVVTPRDCALLLAIPLDLAAFTQAYLDPARDFCRQFAAGTAQVAPRTVWALMFEPAARLVERTARTVERHGVTVVRAARLPDWAAALAAFRVVTLVAHWRFVPITEPDVNDVVALCRYASERASELARVVDDTVRSAAPDRAGIARALDTLCAPAARRYQAVDRRGNPHDRSPSRAWLEYHVPGLRHAPAIELADQMHTVADIVHATPDRYPGVIDLTVCNSILLAEVLKRTRRPMLIASGEFRAQLAFRLIRYRVVIEQLHRRPGRYTELLQELARIHRA